MRRSSLVRVSLIAVFVTVSAAGCVVWRDDAPGPSRGGDDASPVGSITEAAGESVAQADGADSDSGGGAAGGGLSAAPNGEPPAGETSDSGAIGGGSDAAAEAETGSSASDASGSAPGFTPPPPSSTPPDSGVRSVWPWRQQDPTAPPTSVPTLVPTSVPTDIPTPEPTPTVPPTPTEDPFSVAGRPLHLEAPSIGVDAYMEQVGLTSERAMDVPREWGNVAWYRRGYRPGELGNAVVAGHLDTSSGGPAVFWSLHELTPGDEIYVTYENGDRYTFVVEGSEYYLHDAQGPIIDRIFGESLTPDLNLITCDGAWDQGQATYSHRLVVFTTLAPDQTVSADSPATID